MTDKTQSSLETLKEILRHIRTPEELDHHPWTESLFVREALDFLQRVGRVVKESRQTRGRPVTIWRVV